MGAIEGKSEGNSVAPTVPIAPEREVEMNRIYLALMGVALVAGTLFLAASVAFGQTGVDIPDQVFLGDPGEVFHVGTIQAGAGDECIATLTYTNQQPKLSEHPNTDILVDGLTFSDVEHGAFMSAEQPFTATGPVDVALRLGGDGASSGGFHVEVTCNPPIITTTSSPSTSSTTSTVTSSTVTPTTEVPPVSTTTEPAPEGPIDAGGGACSDGACDGVLLAFSATTMLWGGVAVVFAALVLLVWALSHGSRDLSEDEGYNAGADLDHPSWDD